MPHALVSHLVRSFSSLLVAATLCGACDPIAGSSAALNGAGSRCTEDATQVSCTNQSIAVDGRTVVFQTPLGVPPVDGWPVVLNFQGSFFPPSVMWSATSLGITTAFGGMSAVKVIKRLLDGGYAVITPPADLAATAWDTNLPPWSLLWPPAPDNLFLTALFSAIDDGTLGPLSKTRWYATGVSSGGYMTSRMAVSYQSRFRALAIESASYATCAGFLCSVPDLPAGHPPTLFLHGALDAIVPVSTMYAYRDKLDAMGVATRTVVDPLFMHGWIAAAPDEVGSWFDGHP